MMLKFIPTDTSKIGQKRKQCSKACEACRKKKKRCIHLDTQDRNPVADVDSRQDPALERHNLRSGTTSYPAANHVHDGDGMHVGSTLSNPNTAERRNGRRNRDISSHQAEVRDGEDLRDNQPEDLEPALGSRFIGDLNPEGMFLAATSPAVTTGADQAERIGIWLNERLSKGHTGATSLPNETESRLFYGFDPIIQTVMVPLVKEECLALLPPPAELEKLSSVYFEKHHPIFPVINEHAFRTMEPTEPASILLKQGICLVASLNLSAKEHLRLPKSAILLAPREFGRRLSAAMRMSIELDVVAEKIVVAQALCLLSFFIDGLDGGDISSQFCGRAVHFIHSAGLHINKHQRGQEESYAETLLCCVWALDRLNAAFNGRPVLMHERDIGKDLNACFQAQSACFRLFLRVVMLLDEVIGLYRPNSDKTDRLSSEFPLFNDLLEEVGAAQVPTPLLATIETFYHAVAILSCRANFRLENQNSSTSYLRQTHSATQITDTVSHETHKHLSWFPFIPYAISLSLSVSYREMRHSKIPMYRARARSAIIRTCDILQNIEEVSWSAAIMAEMGKATLKEMDRVYAEVANSRRRKSGRYQNATIANEGNELGAGTRAETLAPLVEHETVFATSDTNWASLAEIGNDADVGYGHDPSLPVNSVDFDVFALFDPNFDLEGIDAFLGGNLDMTIPGTF